MLRYMEASKVLMHAFVLTDGANLLVPDASIFFLRRLSTP
jgi:hypothetical protein